MKDWAEFKLVRREATLIFGSIGLGFLMAWLFHPNGMNWIRFL